MYLRCDEWKILQGWELEDLVSVCLGQIIWPLSKHFTKLWHGFLRFSDSLLEKINFFLSCLFQPNRILLEHIIYRQAQPPLGLKMFNFLLSYFSFQPDMICKNTWGLIVTLLLLVPIWVRPDLPQAALDEIGHDPLICDIDSQSNQLTERNAPKFKSL